MTALPWRAPRRVMTLGSYGGLKDPCVVRFRGAWHLFATGCKESWTYDMVHATAPSLSGPWTMLPPCDVQGASGPSLCAPGVVADGERLHLFVQQSYNTLGGTIAHLVSDDGGATFRASDVALDPRPGTSEAGLYDAHPCVVGEHKYLVYAGMATVGEPDLHLARSASGAWDGPWDRLGPILTHDDVTDCHNPRGCDAYEWGLEGGQLSELPDGRTLLCGVCFLPAGEHGTRQRVLLAVADDPSGPYDVLGPAIEPSAYRAAGENGHATAVVHRGRVHLFFQHRDGEGPPWELFHTSVATSALDGAIGAEAGSRVA